MRSVGAPAIAVGSAAVALGISAFGSGYLRSLHSLWVVMSFLILPRVGVSARFYPVLPRVRLGARLYPETKYTIKNLGKLESLEKLGIALRHLSLNPIS